MTKPTKLHVRPAKTQTSLGIRQVWSESSLSAWRNIGHLTTYWAHSEASDPTGQLPRLTWVFDGRTCHFVGFFRAADHVSKTSPTRGLISVGVKFAIEMKSNQNEYLDSQFTL